MRVKSKGFFICPVLWGGGAKGGGRTRQGERSQKRTSDSRLFFSEVMCECEI